MAGDARLVPELYCSDIERTLAFYTRVLGFTVVYDRPEDRFAFLDREGAQIMIEQPRGRRFVAGEVEYPYGRGMNLQIEATDVATLYGAVEGASWPIFLPLEEKWYRRADVQAGSRQFVVQDPDGYLLRFFQDLGLRSIGTPNA